MDELRAESAAERLLLWLRWAKPNRRNAGRALRWQNSDLHGASALIHRNSFLAPHRQQQFQLLLLCSADSGRLWRKIEIWLSMTCRQ